jgi:hypothetical protein
MANICPQFMIPIHEMFPDAPKELKNARVRMKDLTWEYLGQSYELNEDFAELLNEVMQEYS